MKKILVAAILILVAGGLSFAALKTFQENIQGQDTMVVKVFFNNSETAEEYSCNKTIPVDRTIKRTEDLEAKAVRALEALFLGPTKEEKEGGIFTSIPQGVTVKSLQIENGVARADFDETLQFQVGGSCRVSAIRSQITSTLKQFKEVNEVIISIDGRTEDILQP